MNVSGTAAASIVFCAALAATLAPSVIARADDATSTTAPAATAQPADFRKLKAALPATLAGLPRGEATGQRNKLAEVTIANAEAPYGTDEGENAKHGKLTLLDYGNAEMAKGMALWLVAEIDQESDTEWTKTADLQGRRAMLTYHAKEKRGSVQTLAGGRIFVTLELNGVSEAEFRKAADELPLKQLDDVAAGK